MSANPWQHRDAQPVGSGLSPTQLDLIYGNATSIQQGFRRFNAENPRVYTMIVNLARQAKGAGRDHYSIKSIFEVIRWHHEITLKSQEPFKLNNNFSSHYARLVMSRECDLADFFEVRKLRSKRGV